MTKDWVDKRTLKIPGEKIISYFEHGIKTDAIQAKAFQTRRKNLRIQLVALSAKLKELGKDKIRTVVGIEFSFFRIPTHGYIHILLIGTTKSMGNACTK